MKTLFLTWMILGAAVVLFLIFTKPSEQKEIDPQTVAFSRVSEQRSRAQDMEDDPPSTARLSAIAPAPIAPKVETIEELTKNWTVIPPSAFPRRVKLLREVVFKSEVGLARLPPGTSVLALACDKGILNLAPSESSAVRGMVRVGDTDLKTRFRESYDTWATARAEALRKQQAENQRTRLFDEPPTAVPGGVDQTGRPLRNADGSYPVLIASMASGQVTDITPKKIKSWGSPQIVTVEGRPTWIMDVIYSTIVFCGPVEARAQAHVRDGRVIRWVYPGTGEPVP